MKEKVNDEQTLEVKEKVNEEQQTLEVEEVVNKEQRTSEVVCFD